MKAKPSEKPDDDQPRRRGLTMAEYLVCWRRVNERKTTWEALEKAGICKPAKPGQASAFSMRVDEVIAADQQATAG